MIVFVGHTLLLGGIGLDVDNIADTVVHEESGELGGAALYDIVQQPLSLLHKFNSAPLNPRLNMWRVRAR